MPDIGNALGEPLAAVLECAPPDWAPLVEGWRRSTHGQALLAHVDARRAAGAVIYPRAVLRALELTPRAAVRVVILGQDPYHGPGQAEGLAFSVPDGVRVPPSLRNILAERDRDDAARAAGLGPTAGVAPAPAPTRAGGPCVDAPGVSRRQPPAPMSGHLGGWARQGVWLLNTVLTVEQGHPGSHAGKGWEALTDELVRAVAGDPGRRVFMLWGAHAQAKAPLIEAAGAGRHAILMANHPSPLSARRLPRPFVGCGHLGLANAFLRAQADAGPAIDWWA